MHPDEIGRVAASFVWAEQKAAEINPELFGKSIVSRTDNELRAYFSSKGHTGALKSLGEIASNPSAMAADRLARAVSTSASQDKKFAGALGLIINSAQITYGPPLRKVISDLTGSNYVIQNAARRVYEICFGDVIDESAPEALEPPPGDREPGDPGNV
jgi:hypothetical protein